MNTNFRTRNLAFVVVVLSLMLLLGTSAFAQQAPAAGTTIGNQASATYTDGSAVQRTATSNLVVTTVQQVAAFTLTANNAKTATPGAQVIYSHTLTNTGNGADTFTIGLAAAGGFTHTNIAVYLDANNDGIPDNAVNLVGTGTVPLAAGASVHLLVVGTVPVSATSGQTGTLSIIASSVFDNTVTPVTDVDTTTVTGNAVVNLTKSLSATSGASPSGPYTVTLTYTNNGNATATAVNIVDALPAGMTYVAGSGLWSVTGATALTDATGDVQPAAGSPNINYSYATGTITAIINSIPAQTSGTLTFKVNIASGLAPGAINNIATIAYNDGSASVGPFNSNIATFTVNQTPGVTITDTGSSATGDSDNSVNGVQLVASATQGATVSFTNVVKNTGNGTDTFNIALSGSTFPAGTTFVMYKSDGVTPLTDSNADGVADTGPLATNATYNVVIKATLPANASGGGPYNVTATATSTFSSGTTATVIERLTTITANTVDLTNNSPAGTGVPGNGIFPTGEASAQVTNTVNPGATTVFTLYVNNTSATADSYDMLVSTSTTFSGNTLPAGWTIAFQNSTGSDCSTLGSTITNTGVVNAASNKLVCAVITVPAGFAAGPQQIYFRALSSTSNAFDVLHDAVTVNTVHSVTLTPNNTGQIFPGGSVVYVHTLKNNGNVAETVTFTGSFVADSQSLWSSTFYNDSTGTLAGQLDAGDTAVTTSTTISLNPGDSKVMLVKVIAPPSAAAGAADTTTVTATYNAGGSTATANDQSTVIAGDLRLSKLQATSSGCNGTPDAAFSSGTLQAKPLACVVYQITAQNQGTANVTSVVVNDATPTNTTYFDNSGGFKAATTVGTVTNPTSGSAGTITATIGTLTPGQSAVVTFMVKIN